jgi:hypothetical protein
VLRPRSVSRNRSWTSGVSQVGESRPRRMVGIGRLSGSDLDRVTTTGRFDVSLRPVPQSCVCDSRGQEVPPPHHHGHKSTPRCRHGLLSLLRAAGDTVPTHRVGHGGYDHPGANPHHTRLVDSGRGAFLRPDGLRSAEILCRRRVSAGAPRSRTQRSRSRRVDVEYRPHQGDSGIRVATLAGRDVVAAQP